MKPLHIAARAVGLVLATAFGTAALMRTDKSNQTNDKTAAAASAASASIDSAVQTQSNSQSLKLSLQCSYVPLSDTGNISSLQPNDIRGLTLLIDTGSGLINSGQQKPNRIRKINESEIEFGALVDEQRANVGGADTITNTYEAGVLNRVTGVIGFNRLVITKDAATKQKLNEETSHFFGECTPQAPKF